MQLWNSAHPHSYECKTRDPVVRSVTRSLTRVAATLKVVVFPFVSVVRKDYILEQVQFLSLGVVVEGQRLCQICHQELDQGRLHTSKPVAPSVFAVTWDGVDSCLRQVNYRWVLWRRGPQCCKLGCIADCQAKALRSIDTTLPSAGTTPNSHQMILPFSKDEQALAWPYFQYSLIYLCLFGCTVKEKSPRVCYYRSRSLILQSPGQSPFAYLSNAEGLTTVILFLLYLGLCF